MGDAFGYVYAILGWLKLAATLDVRYALMLSLLMPLMPKDNHSSHSWELLQTKIYLSFFPGATSASPT